VYEGTHLLGDGVPFVCGNAYPDGSFFFYFIIYVIPIGSSTSLNRCHRNKYRAFPLNPFDVVTCVPYT